MYKIYFKQAMQILRQNALMSIIAILGTALAITMIMTIIVTDEIRNASVAPEANRNRTYYIHGQVIRDTVNNRMTSSGLSYGLYKDYLAELKTPETTSAMIKRNTTLAVGGRKDKHRATIMETDANYWKILSFTFLQGRPFSEEEFASGIKYAVLSQSMARKLLPDEEMLGKDVLVNNVSYRVIGVVEDVPQVFRNAYSHIWIPYTSHKNDPQTLTLMILAHQPKDYAAIYREVRACEKRYDMEKAPETLFLLGPSNHRSYTLNVSGSSEEEINSSIAVENRKKAFIITILLLVPAINLSGFSLSRINKRMTEIGARKAFGAKKHVILLQVLYENFVTSLIGGIIGLACSYIVVFWLRQWLLGIPSDSSLPIAALVSPMVFVAVFIICMVINLLSAGIPAWKASRMNIVHSLNQNDN